MMTTSEYKKPLPTQNMDLASEPYWEALRNHEIKMQRCKRCSRYVFYPRERCNHCLSPDLEWVKMGTKGRVYMYTIIHQALDAGFNDEVPFPLVIVQLDEGPRIPTNVIGVSNEEIHNDMRVEAVFEDVTPEVTLLKFKPTMD